MTLGLWHEIAAVAVFLFSHSLTNRPAVRRWAMARLGSQRRFTIAYSCLSLLLLGWMIAALRAAPIIALWDQQPWMRWLPPIAMLPVCLLAVTGMTAPNPFSIGPGATGFDPDHPGLLRLTRHPILWALALWSLSHIVPNGDVAALILFVPMALLALAGPHLLDRRRHRLWGDDEWHRLTRLTNRPHLSMIGEIGLWRGVGGVILYLALITLHPWAIGAWPWPWP